MVQSGQGSHSLDGRHKELRQSHWVLFGSDFASCLSIHECGNENRLDLLLVVSQEFPNLDVVDSTAQIGVHEEAASLMLRFVFADHRLEDLCESSPDRLLSGEKLPQRPICIVAIAAHGPKVDRPLVSKCLVETLFGDPYLTLECLHGSMFIFETPEDVDRDLKRLFRIKFLGAGHKYTLESQAVKVDSAKVRTRFRLLGDRKTLATLCPPGAPPVPTALPIPPLCSP